MKTVKAKYKGCNKLLLYISDTDEVIRITKYLYWLPNIADKEYYFSLIYIDNQIICNEVVYA